MKHITRRCTRRRGHDSFFQTTVPRCPAVGEVSCSPTRSLADETTLFQAKPVCMPPDDCHCLYQLDFEGKSVQQEDTYGAAFIRQLTALGRQTPFNYKALQQVKTMG
ncbi:MAG: hypothetical protein ACO3GX_13380 [Gemmataceae bacterium]